jgi:hypothetical protein
VQSGFPVAPAGGKDRPGTGARTEQPHLTETTMSDLLLPAEMLDHIVDYLHNTQEALRNCCLVSKSWVPRIRKYLFAEIAFRTIESLDSWKEMFPDPSTSPARYAKCLLIDYPHAVTAGSWIEGFTHVERLDVSAYPPSTGSTAPLVPLHGLSPVIKSLHVNMVAFPPSQIINFILSFPLLEDLAVTIYHGISTDNSDDSEEDEIPAVAQPLSLPIFTRSLELHLKGVGAEPFIRRLSSLPGGIHFWKLTLTCFSGRTLLLTTALVEGCSRTLESLDITCDTFGAPSQYLCPHRQFTTVPRHEGDNFDRPLECDKTQRYSSLARIARGQMGHHGTPDHHTQAPGSSADLNLYSLPVLYQHRGTYCNRESWGMVGPRSSLHPTLGMAFDSSEVHTHEYASHRRSD